MEDQTISPESTSDEGENQPTSTNVQIDSSPQQIVIKQSNRQSFWLLIAVGVGFLLPMIACGLIGGIMIFSAGLGAGLGGSSALDTGSGPAVAIVRVEGVIVGTDDTEVITGAGSGTVIADLKAAEANDDVKAIVLRVDSPGGTVTGSAQIHEYIRDEVEKPVVVSMASTAASGGYYISAPADYIFARADTTTGSLGVILSLFNVSDLMDEWGVDVVNITSGPNKALGSPYSDLDPEHVEILEAMIDESYNEFVQIIVDGRGLPDSEVRQIADGRIYSGRQAVELGLVDELGNFNDAISHAADMGGIAEDPRIIEFERVPDFQDLLTGFSQAQSRTTADEIFATIEQYGIPRLEYRYAGP